MHFANAGPASNATTTMGMGAADPPLAADQLDVTFTEDALGKLASLFALHGDAFRVYSPALQRDLLVFSHPDHAKHVLVTNHANYTKGIGIERVRILLGNGIMASEGELWRAQRKMVQPTFHRTVIASMFEHMHHANLRLAQRWLQAANSKQAVNLTQDMSEVTLEIVLRALFGDRFAALIRGNSNPFAVLTDDTERNLAFAYKFRALSRLVMDEINERRRIDFHGQDIASLLLAARDRRTGAPMPDRQLLDEIMTLIVAGHETTASALNWTWYLLSQHPEAENRLHAELDALDTSEPGVEDVARLTYTRQVIEETMRLYPPGWLLTRRSIASDVVGGYAVAPNTDVLVSPYLIHRHPEWWPEPDRFDPDRFAVTATLSRNRFAYLPFGLGPRACIGEPFALVEMQLHIAVLARRFRLELDPREPIELEPQVNLRTRHPLFFHLRAR